MVFLRPDRFVAGACLTQDGPATLDAILRSMSFTGREAHPAAVVQPDLMPRLVP
jgi:3-(3-hydroxy-phenyl)propionate hydroxylase